LLLRKLDSDSVRFNSLDVRDGIGLFLCFVFKIWNEMSSDSVM